MKAQSLWIGSDYAYTEYRGRGRPLPLNAKRVKVLSLEKVVRFGKSKDETYVEVMMLTEEGTPDERYNARTPKVRGRDIINFWDDYLADVTPLRKEREERDKRYEEDRKRRQLEREERDAAVMVGTFIRGVQISFERREKLRLEEEKRQAHVKRQARLENVLVTKGLKREEFAVRDSYITINLEEMERWLGFDK